MNYAGKFDATFASEGPDTHSHAYVNVDSSHTHAPADAIIVPDAQLLFHADYSRSGSDLVLSRDHHQFLLHDYFRGEKRAPLASPDGAHLTADIVKALVGEVEVSQAGDAAAASQVIGHVTKLQGSATVLRNGVSIILNMGDNVEKGDVVESGSNSTLGITFIDGTVFGLSSNARMVLNEMVYDPNGSNNSSLMSLVAGTITFVAGETAKHGDMKVDTPVATMGIRGTAVLVEIDFTVPGQNAQPNASFQVLVEPDGTTGSYILFDKTTLQPIAIVNQAGQQVNINNGIINITTNPLSPDLQKLITDVFQQKFTDNTNPNTKSTAPSTDSIVPTSNPLIIKTAEALITAQTVHGQGSSTPPPPPTQSDSTHHIAGLPIVHIGNLLGVETTSFLASGELPGLTGSPLPDGAGGIVNFNDINVGDHPTVSAAYNSFTYKNAHGQDVTAGLSPLQLADIAATEVKLNVVAGANNTNIGSAIFTYGVADQAFDFLAAGEQITLSYTITVNDNFAPAPEIVNIPITITITGTNDVPVITTSAQSIAFRPSGTNTKGGDLQTPNPTSGVLAFTDVDLTDTHTVSTALTSVVMSNGGTLPPLPESVFENALTASIDTDSTGTGNGTIDWRLAPLQAYLADFIPLGQAVTLTYTVTVTDTQGATATQTITVVIPGGNSPAVVWIHTTTDGHDNLWSDKLNWGTGAVPIATDDVIISTDQLHPNTPSYPVTIDGSTPAVANSVTMNDHVNLPPELDVAQGGSLTIGAALTLHADSKLNNAGTITVGGKAELTNTVDDNGNPVPNQSLIINSGTLNLEQGGDLQGLADITNTGAIDLQGGALEVLVDIANSGTDTNGKAVGGQITVEKGSKLAFGHDANDPSSVNGGITGGTLTIIGELDLQGSNFLDGGTLDNSGHVYVASLGNSFDAETIATSGTIEVKSGAALTIDRGSSVSGSGTITIDGTATLTLNDAEIGGGSLGNSGTINVVGTGNSFDGETITANNALEMFSGGALTIDHGSKFTNTSLTIDRGGYLRLDDTSTISGGTLTNGGSFSIEASTGAALEGVKIQNAGGTMHVDVGPGGGVPSPATLIVESGTTISNGTLDIGGVGTLDNVSDSNALHGVTINVDSGGLLESTGGTLTIDTAVSATLINSGAVEANGGELAIATELVTNNNALDAVNGGKLKLGSTTVTNSGTVTVDQTSELDLASASILGGNLSNAGMLDNLSGSDTISAAVTNTGSIEVKAGTLDLAGGVKGGGHLIVDAGAMLELGRADAETISLQGGTGTTTLQLDSATVPFNGTITANATGGGTFAVTGQGNITTSSGDALDFNASGGTSGDPANVTLNLGGAIMGAANGISVTQNGAGAVSVTTSGSVEGLAGDGIEMTRNGVGSMNVDVTGKATGTGTGSVGLDVQNLDASDNSNIGVTAAGGASGEAYGIDIVNAGNGNITLEADGTIVTGNSADSEYGIRVVSEGTGSETVTTDADTNITSDASGINVANISDDVPLVDGDIASNITVNAHGTIHSGSALNLSGSVAGGIYAGYRGAPPQDAAQPVLNVYGNVTVNNYAKVTADTGYGIDAYDYGNGNVTVNDEAGTTVTGAQYGVAAFALSGGIGDVTVAVAENATITGTSAHAIVAENTGAGNVTVTTSDGDTLNSGASGITAYNSASSLAAGTSVSVTARGTINSGTINNPNGTSPGGIEAGYFPGSTQATDDKVAGNVFIDSYATILAAAGYGIEGYNWGTGNVTITAEATSSIAATGTSVTGSGNAGIGIGAYANDGGNVSVTQEVGAVDTGLTGLVAETVGAATITIANDGEIFGTGGDGILVNQAATGATGSTTIINSGSVTGVTSETTAVVVVHENATGLSTIDNSGTIGKALVSGTPEVAIYEDGGKVSIDNHGMIDGTINVGSGTFTNDGTGIWNVAGSSVFGTSSGAQFTIDNDGTINLSGSASLSSAHGLTIDNADAINSTGTDFIGDAGITNTGAFDVKGGSLTLTATTLTNSVADADGTVAVNGNGGALDLSSSSISGGLVTNAGTIKAIDPSGTGNAVSSIDATITNNGSIEIAGGKLTLSGTISGSGSLQIDGGAKLELNLADGQDVAFSGSGGELIVDSTGSVTGNIRGLAATDEIDLRGIDYTTATANYANGVLTVTDGHGDTVNLNIGTVPGLHFAGINDGGGGTLITLNANDDAPAFTQTSESGSIAEQANTTGSPSLDSTSGTLSFTDVDLTDRPAASITAQSVVWTAADGTTDLSASLTQAEIAELDQALRLTGGATNNNGSVGWNYSIADGALDFLGQGQTLKVTSMVTVDDHQGQTGTAQALVTINGANDAPHVSYLPGYFNFDGQTAAVGSASTGQVGNGADGVTLQGWADWNGQGAAGSSQLLFYNGSTSDAGFGVNGVVTANGTLDLQIQTGGINGIDTGIKIGSAQWYDIALTHTGGLFTLDVDGVAEFTTSENVNTIPGNFGYGDYTQVGGATISGSFSSEGFTGSIADVSVWNTALTQSQIASTDFTALTGHEPNLAAYYPLDDGSGTTASDLTNSSESLAIHGTASWVGGTSNAVTTNEDASVTIKGLVITDPDAGSSAEQLTLSVAHGALALGSASGLTGTLTGATLTLTGTLAAIDAALAGGVTYTPTSGYSGADALSVQINDQAPSGSALTACSSVAVSVTPDVLAANNDAIVNAAPSGDGWALDSENGHYYRLVTTYLGWSDANAKAQADGAYLATITSAGEQAFITPLAAGNRAWLGGGATDDATGTGHFVWLTGPEAGTPFDFTHWRVGEPNGGFGSTEYVHIEGVDDPTNGGWNDAPNDAGGRDFIEEWGGLSGQIAFNENTGTTIADSVLLADDTDSLGKSFAITAVSGQSIRGGAVTLDGNSIDYTPAANYSGDDSFTYTIFDGITTSTGTVSFTVAPSAGAPVVTVAAGAATFTTLDEPGTFKNAPGAINDAGVIVGGAAADADHQIAWEYSGGTFTRIGSSLGAQDVTGHDINNNDVIVGDYSPIRSTPRYGFVDNNGTFTQIASDSPYPSTNANGINDSGVVVGSDYLHGGARYTGYIESGGTFVYFNVPGTVNASGDTFANGINNEGLVAGSYNPNAGNGTGYHGFVYDSVHGTYTDIADPNGAHGTFASAINDHGQVVGWYVDAGGVDHGFIENGGIYTTIDDPLGAHGTVLTGINNSDQIVGYTIDSSGNSNGFETSFSGTLTAENTPLVLNSVNVLDPAAGGNSIQVQLSVLDGTLALNNPTGVSASFDAGHDIATLTGSAAAIDTALAEGVIYTPTNGFAGNDTLTVAANDEGHNSSGTPQTTTQTQALSVVGGPVIETDKFTVTANDNGTTTVSGLQVNDTDASASSETFSLTASTANSDSSVTPGSDTGSLARINSALSSIVYHPTSLAADMVNVTVTDGFGAADAVHFVFNENGSGPGTTLQGTVGNDVIFATGNADTMTGNGGIDQFVFKPTGGTDAVQHTVTDFNASLDSIDLRLFGSGLSAANLIANATQQGPDTVLHIDAHDSILLQKVQLSSLHTSDFILHS